MESKNVNIVAPVTRLLEWTGRQYTIESCHVLASNDDHINRCRRKHKETAIYLLPRNCGEQSIMSS